MHQKVKNHLTYVISSYSIIIGDIKTWELDKKVVKHIEVCKVEL